MGKVLKVLGVLFLVLIVGVVLLMVWAHSKSGEEMRSFFNAVASEDPQQFYGLVGSDLRAEMDEPVTRMWMAMLNDKLGAFQGVSATDFHTESKSVEAGWLVETKGAANFEKGAAQVRLTLLDGRVVGFEIESDNLRGRDWLKFDDAAKAFYFKRAETFLKTLAAGEAEAALQMMHPELRKQISADRISTGMSNFRKQYGAVKEIRLLDAKRLEDPADISLLLVMQVVCEKQTAPAFVRFDFDKARGHLLAFRLPGEPD